MPRSPRTPEWLRTFARAYLAHGRNATKAYLDLYPDAGRERARSKAAQLLKNKDVQAAIEEAIIAMSKKFDTSLERLMLEAARIAFLDPQALLDADGRVRDLTEMDEDARRAIAGMDVDSRTSEDGEVATVKKIKISDKLRALEFIAKLQGQMVEKREISGNITLLELFDDDLKRGSQEPDMGTMLE